MPGTFSDSDLSPSDGMGAATSVNRFDLSPWRRRGDRGVTMEQIVRIVKTA
jgi:hypothetical protein